MCVCVCVCVGIAGFGEDMADERFLYGRVPGKLPAL